MAYGGKFARAMVSDMVLANDEVLTECLFQRPAPRLSPRPAAIAHAHWT